MMIDVLDYGVVADGVTDDTAALQAAIDAAQEGDTVIMTRRGVCRITRSLMVKGKRVGVVGLSLKERPHGD